MLSTAENSRLKESFTRIKKDISELKNEILEIKELVRKKSADYSADKSVKSPLEVRKNTLNRKQRKVLKGMHKIKLVNEIERLSLAGMGTTDIMEEVTEKFKIKRTAFYKYLSLVRKKSVRLSAE